ncbi:MAG: hypothetical protein KDF55_08880 [Thauera sp.]|nr:hypothetical protein [Thauera sp.]
MIDQRQRHEMRAMISRVSGQVAAGRLPLRQAAEVLNSQRVPFEVACRVLRPYARSTSTT